MRCRVRFPASSSATRCSMRCRCSSSSATASSWLERGVACEGERFVFADRPTALAPPEAARGDAGRLDDRAACPGRSLHRDPGRAVEVGAAFFVDYGFPAHEYYHPQRSGGTRDVPPGAPAPIPIRSPTWAQRTSPRMSTSPASRWPAQEAGFDVDRLHLAGPLSPELRDPRPAGRRRRAHDCGGAEAPRRARDGRAVQGARLRERVRVRADRLRRAAIGGTRCDRIRSPPHRRGICA